MPAVALTLLLVLASAVAAGAGLVPLRFLTACLSAAPLVSLLLVAAAAASSQKGQLPLEELFAFGDLGLQVLFLWHAMGPLLALIGVGIPLLGFRGALSSGADAVLALGNELVVVAALLGLAVTVLRRRRLPA